MKSALCVCIAVCMVCAIPAVAKTPKGSLFRYAKTGDLEKAKELVEKDPTVVHKRISEGGFTSLYFAAKYNHAAVAKYLFSKKADPNEKSAAGAPVMHITIARKAPETLKAFLKAGADPDIKDADGNTPLYLAITQGSADLAEILLDAKADPTARDAQGRTPLHIAVALGQKGVIETLLKKKVPTNAKDASGQTPLHRAVRAGKPDIVSVLAGNGADTGITDGTGATALHWAVAERRKGVTVVLLVAGADVKAKNAFGQTSLDIADDAMAALLRTPKAKLPPVDATKASSAGLAAFPGAGGFGMWASGGRGGKVIHVTTLADSGPGSLRAALEQRGPRIIVFDVGGVIHLKTTLRVRTGFGNYTIAGQTAPGGITLAGAHFSPAAFRNMVKNFIIRHIRVRATAGGEHDGMSMYGRNFVIDHMSVTGGCDENIAGYSSEYTLQWCTVEESSFWGQAGASHAEGSHNYGFLQGYNPTAKLTIHHSLFANHQKRNPLISGITKGGADVRNNVTYNYVGTGLKIISNGGRFNVVNNCFVLGPSVTKKHRTSRHSTVISKGALLYPPKLEGNLFFPKPPGTAPPETKIKEYRRGGHTYVDKPWAEAPPVETEPAMQAFHSVMDKAGAWPRDATTRRTILEARDGTKTGGVGLRGPYEAIPEREGPCAAKSDTDRDGMPDAWEKKHGLDPKNPKDCHKIVPAADKLHAGRTYIEYYLNELADNIVGKSGKVYAIVTVASPADAGAVIADHGVVGWETKLNGGYNRPFWFGLIPFGTEQYNEDSLVIMKAKPKPGYVFKQWQGGPVDGLTATRVSFPAKADVKVTAAFEKLAPCNVSVNIIPADAGAVAGDGAHAKGDIVTLAAYGSKGYVFKRWTGGPADKAASPTVQFAATGAVTLTAEFEKGGGGDVLIDDFNDKNFKSKLPSDRGVKIWKPLSHVSFQEVAPGNFGMTTKSRANRDLDLRDGYAVIPEGATVLKFKVYNVGDKPASIRSTRHTMSFGCKGFKAGLFHAPPFRFPTIEPKGVGTVEIPLALVRSRKLGRMLKPGMKLGRFHFRGAIGPVLWGTFVVADDVAFGRASAAPIKAPNLPPVAQAGRDQVVADLDGDGKELVLLDGTSTYDRDAGLIKSWAWTLGGKPLAERFAPQVELPVGTHKITLTVADEQGGTAADTVTVTIR